MASSLALLLGSSTMLLAQPAEQILLADPSAENTITITEEDLPDSMVLAAFVRHAGAVIENNPDLDAHSFLEGFGLDPSKIDVSSLVRLQARLVANRAKALERLRHEYVRLEKLKKRARTEDRVSARRHHHLSLAQFEGAALGKWLVGIEARGLTAEKLIETIRRSEFSVSRVFVNESPDVEFEVAAAKKYRMGLERALGRSLRQRE